MGRQPFLVSSSRSNKKLRWFALMSSAEHRGVLFITIIKLHLAGAMGKAKQQWKTFFSYGSFSGSITSNRSPSIHCAASLMHWRTQTKFPSVWYLITDKNSRRFEHLENWKSMEIEEKQRENERGEKWEEKNLVIIRTQRISSLSVAQRGSHTYMSL